jgi:hypothetical protein
MLTKVLKMTDRKLELNEHYVGSGETTIDDITTNVVVLMRCRSKQRVAEEYAVANIEPDESPKVLRDVLDRLIDEYVETLEQGCEDEESDHELEAFVIGGHYVKNISDQFSKAVFYRTFRNGKTDAETYLDVRQVERKRFPHQQDELARKRLVVKAKGRYEFTQSRDEGNESKASISEDQFKLLQIRGVY